MRRRSYRSRWSRREWACRGLAAILVAIIAGFSLSFSIAQTLSKSSAARAYRLAPYDGRITALLAASLAAADASVSDRRRSDMLAREALDRDPTAIAALSTLGINAQVRGDMAGARRLFTYAEHLSRRDPQTQLWAIENAVSRGAVAEALSKYDIALRTSPRLAPLLYPVLTEASIDPRIRIELVRTFASKPGWSGNFLEFASSKSTDPGSLALLFVALRRAGMSIPNSANSNLIAKLMMGGMAERAWNYYAILRPGVDRRRSRDSRFDYDNDVPSVLDWMLVNDEGAASSIQRGDSGGVFVFSVSSSGGGPVLQQMQLLPPGEYRLDGHSTGVESSGHVGSYWLLKCQNGTEIGRIALPPSTRNGGSFSGRFTLGQGCPVQTLVLVVRPSDAVGGASGEIDRVALTPVASSIDR